MMGGCQRDGERGERDGGWREKIRKEINERKELEWKNRREERERGGREKERKSCMEWIQRGEKGKEGRKRKGRGKASKEREKG